MTDTSPAAEDNIRQQQAEADKAVADARSAEAAATQAEQQLAERNSPLARQEREAQSHQAIAQADQATAAAKQAQISALIPDFSKVDRGSTTIQGQQAVGGSVLARRAIENAVNGVIAEIKPILQSNHASLLITADADLATSDAAFGEVVRGLIELSEAAEHLLNPPVPKPPPGGGKFAPAIAGAVASAIPPLLSLLSPNRTLSSFAIGPDNTAAMAVLAGILAKENVTVRIDDFRPVPQGRVFDLDSDLRAKRLLLVNKKLETDTKRVQADTERASHQTEVDNLTKVLDGLPPSDPKYAGLEAELRAATEQRDSSARATADATLAVGVLADLLGSTDGFLAAIHAVPSSGGRSPFTIAALREDLHRVKEQDPTVFVLYVSASGGSTDQMFNDRPLFFKDKFESIAGISVSYWLVDPKDGRIVVAGSAAGTSRMKGVVGGSLSFDIS